MTLSSLTLARHSEPGTPPTRSMQAAPAGLMLALLAILQAPPLHAEGYGLTLRHGEAGGDYRGDGISLRLPTRWSADWSGWTATLRPAVEINRFRYDGGLPGPRYLNEAGALGLFRVERANGAVRPYAEAGLGLTLLSRSTLGNKDLSTRFQFSEQIGLGVRFAERWSAGWRYSHYSNGDIKMPNDGIDMQQIELGVDF